MSNFNFATLNLLGKLKKKKICPQKIEKITLKSCSEFFNQFHFFLPKRPKQKNSYSKMWPIDQLYIELGPTCSLC